MTKRALITGVTGQDGSYLADFLVGKGYEVHGMVRQSSTNNRGRIAHLSPEQLTLHFGDMTDAGSLERIVRQTRPDEIYHMASQSHVHVSFDIPEYTINAIALGTVRLLEAMRDNAPTARMYNASTSEMFGNATEMPQSEITPFKPASPYASAKVLAHEASKQHRRNYCMFIVNGILFNHESERRGEEFVTRKITKSLSRIKMGSQSELVLGNLDARRDWGYSPDYVEMMWRMLQQERPDDYVVGTDETRSVREFLEISAKEIGLDIESNKKSGVDEKYLDPKGNVIVRINPLYFRPTEVDVLVADSRKAIEELGWRPKTGFFELVQRMCQHDMRLARQEFAIKSI